MEETTIIISNDALILSAIGWVSVILALIYKRLGHIIPQIEFKFKEPYPEVNKRLELKAEEKINQLKGKPLEDDTDEWEGWE